MTMLPFQCPHCGGSFQITPELVGQPVACPHCSNAVFIPQIAIAATDPPATAVAQSRTEPPICASEPSAPPVSASPVESTFSPPPVLAPQQTCSPSERPQQDTLVTTRSKPATPARSFVISTIDGAQTVINEPTRIAVSGSKHRQLRDATTQEKESRRAIKNIVIFTLCAVLLGVVLWWLLNHQLV